MTEVDPERLWIFAGGKLVPPDTPVLRADDAGFLLGLSVFDTVLYEDGDFHFLQDHLARIERGARELGISWPPGTDPETALRAVVEHVGADPLALRMTVSRGPVNGRPDALPTFVVTPRAVVRPEDPGVVVALAPERRLVGDRMGQVKSTNRISYVLAREQAARAGAWEALFVSDEDDVLEGTVSNVFVFVDGELRTPPVERGCLPGTMRGRVLALAAGGPLKLEDGREVPVREARIDLADLDRAEEVFLTNTTGGATGVVEVRDRVRDLPGAAGPVTRAVREGLRASVAADRAPREG